MKSSGGVRDGVAEFCAGGRKLLKWGLPAGTSKTILLLGSVFAVKRVEWQQLAERWLTDAQVLLDGHCWSAAYYLAGYAVECGLKSCVLARLAVSPEVIFENKRFSENCWTHSVLELVKLADLEIARASDVAGNAHLARNWLVVKDWSEKARYQKVSHHKAKKLFLSITDKHNGVMQWIRARW